MRNDHVFYGHIGGAHPTPEDIEHAMREARRIRAVALHNMLRERFRGVAALFRRRPAARLRTC